MLQRGPTLGTVVGAALVLAMAVSASGPIFDNSFLTHLGTGRFILHHGFPHADPFSFTAKGTPWVLPSWFPSVIYGGLEEVFGAVGIRFFTALISGCAMALVWRLARPARGIVGRVVAVVPAFVVGIAVWGQRPQLIGLLCLLLIMVVVDEERDPRWVVPILWVWVNSHGSFPIVFPLLGLAWLGSKLDKRSTRHLERVAAWSLVGLVASLANPYGWKILWTPVQILQRRDMLKFYAEWSPPDFASAWQMVFLLGVALAILAIPRMQSGDRFHALLPVLLLVGMSVTSARNILLASAMLPMVSARQLRSLGTVSGAVRGRALSGVFVVLCIGGLAASAQSFAGPNYDLSGFPSDEVQELMNMDLLGSQSRLLAPETVGNYLVWQSDGDIPIFIDDRADVVPRKVFFDFQTIRQASPGWEHLVDEYRIDLVLWPSDTPLAQALQKSPAWVPVADFRDSPRSTDRWVAFQPAVN